jgi:putative addiction module CopG family antidote
MVYNGVIMDISLKPELRKYAEEQVKAGRFSTVDEVLEAGVARLMLDSEDGGIDEETLAAIERADAQLERGEGIPADEAFNRLRAKHLGN